MGDGDGDGVAFSIVGLLMNGFKRGKLSELLLLII